MKGKAKPLPPIDYLRERLAYDPETGELTWKAHADLSRRIKPGDLAGYGNSQGYRVIEIIASACKAHRIAYAIHYGVDPIEHGEEAQVDHINGDRADNRIANLRIVTRAENLRNKSEYANNKSGHTGISRHKKTGKWQVNISGNYLGLFENLDDAVAAREAANEKYNYHVNHGRAA